MLRLLPSALCKNATERQLFLRDILLFVFAVHVLFFVAMVGSSMLGKKHDLYAISMHQTGATYVLMPLHKRVDQSLQKSKRKGSSKLSSSKVLNYDDYQKRKNKQSSKSAAVAKPNTSVARKNSKSMGVKSKPSMVLAESKVATTSKVVPLSKGKNRSKINKVNAIKIDPVLDVEAVVALPKQEPEPQVSEQPKETPIEPEKIIQGAAQELSTQEVEPNQESVQDFDEENIIFVGYEQLDGCMVGAKIQQEIIDRWTPPVGIAPGASCLMRVKISSQGIASDVVIEKSSGVLVYDMSSRAALLEVQYPKEVYGKTITLALTN